MSKVQAGAVPCLRLGVLVVCVFSLASGCGGASNVADCSAGKKGVPCDKSTQDEQARAALNKDPSDFAAAITLLNDLIAAEPTNYTRHPLLAAAYAGRAGLDLLNVAKAQFAGGGSDLLASLSTFISCPAAAGDGYKACVGDMKSAIDVLHLIPAADLSATSADRYATSALLQLTLYQAAYPVMFLKEFTTSATGTTDLSQLSTMSPDDAANFISNLAAAGQLPSLPGATPALQTKVNDALAQIAAEPGATQKDKIAAFVAANQAAKGAAATATATDTGTATDTATDTSTATSGG